MEVFPTFNFFTTSFKAQVISFRKFYFKILFQIIILAYLWRGFLTVSCDFFQFKHSFPLYLCLISENTNKKHM